MAVNFDHPTIDWEASDLFQEFRRFREHVNFVFEGPLAQNDNKVHAGWLGTWIGAQGREIYRTLDWEAGEKKIQKKFLTNSKLMLGLEKTKE